jgi:hypothetical protein
MIKLLPIRKASHVAGSESNPNAGTGFFMNGVHRRRCRDSDLRVTSHMARTITSMHHRPSWRGRPLLTG